MRLKRTIGVSLVTGAEVEFIERDDEIERAGEILDSLAREMHLATVRRVLRGQQQARP